MKARFFKEKYLKELELKVEDNLEKYRSGNFDFEADIPDHYFEVGFEIDDEKLKTLLPSNKN